MSIASNIESIREQMTLAALSAGRKIEDIRLVGVTKTVDAQAAAEVMAAGVTDLGENRVQSFLDKYEVLGDRPTWHLIGHLQTNKVKYIVGKVSLIHSVDSVHLAEAISERAEKEGVVQDILLQFNISGEESKSGKGADEALRFSESVSALSGVRVRGLMTMAPLLAEEKEIREIFAGLRSLSETIKAESFEGFTMEHLSMGMSGDFPAAIREGATLIRVGSALFR